MALCEEHKPCKLWQQGGEEAADSPRSTGRSAQRMPPVQPLPFAVTSGSHMLPLANGGFKSWGHWGQKLLLSHLSQFVLPACQLCSPTTTVLHGPSPAPLENDLPLPSPLTPAHSCGPAGTVTAAASPWSPPMRASTPTSNHISIQLSRCPQRSGVPYSPVRAGPPPAPSAGGNPTGLPNCFRDDSTIDQTNEHSQGRGQVVAPARSDQSSSPLDNPPCEVSARLPLCARSALSSRSAAPWPSCSSPARSSPPRWPPPTGRLPHGPPGPCPALCGLRRPRPSLGALLP